MLIAIAFSRSLCLMFLRTYHLLLIVSCVDYLKQSLNIIVLKDTRWGKLNLMLDVNVNKESSTLVLILSESSYLLLSTCILADVYN